MSEGTIRETTGKERLQRARANFGGWWTYSLSSFGYGITDIQNDA
jgi:hypothetical protein